MADSNSDDDNAVPSEKRPTPRGPAEDPPGRLLGNFSKHKLGKIVGGGQEKKKYPVRQCRVCSAHKSGVKHAIFVSIVLCHFTKEAVSKNITH
jgi:hypothetical protein